nr:reverse transcriptase domain-containing protein [Tanacetum cinerariifolium]
MPYGVISLKTLYGHSKLHLKLPLVIHHTAAAKQAERARDQAYENSLIYKERTKKLHNEKIKNRIFNVGDQVLLFNSRLKIFLGLFPKIEAFLCWNFCSVFKIFISFH